MLKKARRKSFPKRKSNLKNSAIPIITPNTINFGQLEVGKVKRENVKITNKGYGDLAIKKVFLKNGVEFGIKKTTCTKPLGFNQSCEITVEFKPDAPGNYTDVLNIRTNDKKKPIYEVKLAGEAIGAVIEVTQNNVGAVSILPPPPPPNEQQSKSTKKNVTEKKSTKQVESTQKSKKKELSKKKEQPKKQRYTYWTVKPCDTLWDISSQVYGTPLLWAAIYEANKNLITDPWIIEVGTKLKIPKLTPAEREKYKKETLKLMEEMADRPLGPKCPF